MTTMRERLERILDPFFSAADRAYGEPAKAADAVLAELREPDETLVEQGARQISMVGDDWAQTKSIWDDLPDYGRDHLRDQARCGFIAMIDKAREG